MKKLSTLLLALLMIVAIAACGDDASTDPTATDPTSATTAAAGDMTTTTAAGTSDDDMGDGDMSDDDMGSGDMMGHSYADVTVDGTTIRFAAANLEFSPIEGVQDITFEECDPDFFGVGFWVIGYPVDAGGEMLMEDDGMNLSGILSTTIPFEGTDPELLEFEFDVEYAPLGLDARFRPEDGSPFAYEFDGNRVTGSATLDQYGEAVDVTFNIVCAG